MKAISILLLLISSSVFANSFTEVNPFGTLSSTNNPNVYTFTTPSNPNSLDLQLSGDLITVMFSDNSYRELNYKTKSVTEVSKVIKTKFIERDNDNSCCWVELRSTKTYNLEDTSYPEWKLEPDNEVLLSAFMQFQSAMPSIDIIAPIYKGKKYLQLNLLRSAAQSIPEEACAFEEGQAIAGFNGFETLKGCESNARTRLMISAITVVAGCTIPNPHIVLTCLTATANYANDVDSMINTTNSCNNSFAVAKHNLETCEKNHYGGPHVAEDPHLSMENGLVIDHMNLVCKDEDWYLYTGLATPDGWYCEKWTLMP